MKWISAIALCLVSSTAWAQASSSSSASLVSKEEIQNKHSDAMSLSVGGSYSSGDFGGATNTEIWSLPIVARMRIGRLQLSGSLPWMSVKSEGTLFTGIDSTPLVVAPGITSTPSHRKGFGDLTVGASYDLLDSSRSGFDVQLSGRVKIPTASDRSQLSTGKTDYALGARVSKPVGNVIPYFSATYRIFGDSGPWNLRNGIATSAGASYVWRGRTTLIASYDYARAASPFVRDSHEIFAGLSMPVGSYPLRLTAFGTVGLSQGAPDAAGGLALAASF